MADLLLPFEFPFMRQAFLIAALVALPTALLSVFVVLKGWSLLGDAISHAVLPGVILAYVVGLPIAVGAFVAGMACALMSGWLEAQSRLKPDTAMGVVFSGLFGLGLVLYASVETTMHLSHLLFGDMLGVGWRDVALSGGIATIVTAAVLAARADLLAVAFDPVHAAAIGLRTRTLHYGLMALVALSVVGALAAVGLILAIALLITPGATALLWTQRFGRMLPLSAAIGVGASVVGVYASFWLDSAPAPTVVLAMVIVFLASLGLTRPRPQRA